VTEVSSLHNSKTKQLPKQQDNILTIRNKRLCWHIIQDGEQTGVVTVEKENTLN